MTKCPELDFVRSSKAAGNSFAETLNLLSSQKLSDFDATRFDAAMDEVYSHTPSATTDKRKYSSPYNGKKGGRPPPPSHADTAELYAHTALYKNDILTTRHWHGQWFTYEKGMGWMETPDIEIQNKLITFLRQDPELRSHATSHYAASVMLNLRAHDLCGLPENIEQPCWLDTNESARNWVAFKNNIVVNIWAYAEALARGETPENHTRELSPNFFSRDYVEYPWDPDNFPEKFHSYLNRVQPDTETVRAIARMLGLLMADTCKYETFWQMFGNGSNGKTVLLDIIKAMVGKSNLAYVPLPKLIERFGAWPLAGAKVNICGELPTDVGRGQLYQIEGEFKNCVSGGEIEYEQKGKDKYPAKCRARFVMATNSLPTFVDKSDGIWRRLNVIPFNVQIPPTERNADLSKAIIATDMPGILSWALDGLAEIIKDGYVRECPSGEKEKNTHRSGCDHEKTFLEENYRPGDHDEKIKSADLYDAYRNWMQNCGYRSLGLAKFMARVLEIFPKSAHKTMRFPAGLAKGFDYIAQVDAIEQLISKNR